MTDSPPARVTDADDTFSESHRSGRLPPVRISCDNQDRPIDIRQIEERSPMSPPTAEQRADLAHQLRAYADAIAAGRAPLPALRYQDLHGEKAQLRVVPRVLHDVLCSVRIATPQTDSDPVVSHCAFCDLCYPRDTTPFAATETTTSDPRSDRPSERSKEAPA